MKMFKRMISLALIVIMLGSTVLLSGCDSLAERSEGDTEESTLLAPIDTSKNKNDNTNHGDSNECQHDWIPATCVAPKTLQDLWCNRGLVWTRFCH